MSSVATDLGARLTEIRAKNPHAYPRDYAAMLGVSEAELTPVFYADRALELQNLEAVLLALAQLPRIKLMARTAFAVFELFTKVDFHREGSALVLSSASCFVALAANELGRVYFLSPAAEKEKAAVLVFDRSGTAALKIYIEAHEFDVSLLKAEAAAPADAAADLTGLIAKARQSSAAIDAKSARTLVEETAAEKGRLGFELSTPAIAVYMAHAPIKVVDARGWFNILDDDFNLHLKEEAILSTETGAAMRLTGAAGESIKLWRLT